MRKSLGKILQWILLGVLFLGIPSALADPINTIAGGAVLDTSSPRVWRHGTATTTQIPGTIATSTSQYIPVVYAVVGACEALATCTSIAPIAQYDPDNDGELVSLNTLATSAFGYAFNGTTWDRLRSGNSGDSDTGIGKLHVLPMLFNSTNADFERGRTAGGDALSGQGILASGNILLNSGGTWDRARSATDFTAGTGIPGSVGLGLSSGTVPQAVGWNQLRTAGALPLTLTVGGPGAPVSVPYSTWSVTSTPATATQATASRAAGAAGVRHVATTVTACLAAGATAQTPVVVNLRDGATGAGTVLRSWAISAPVNDSKCVDLSGLAMLGTAATAMTIEFAAAGVAASQETVTLTGFSTQ